MKPHRWPTVTTCLLALCWTLAACHKNIPPPQDAIDDPSILREAVDARLELLPDARLREVVLDYFGEDERIKVRQLILVKRPDKLRVQTRIPGTNEILSVLVSDGERFAMHERDTNRYYTGPATPDNIDRLLPVGLSARDVVRVMLGGAPWDRLDQEPGSPQLTWNRRTGRYRYSVRTATDGMLHVEIRPTDYAVVSMTETNPRGEALYEYETDDWERHGSASLPVFRRFVWPERDLDFSLDVGQTQIGVDLSDALFVLPPPAGSDVIAVDEDPAG